jgi:hypothetical protein
VPGAEGVVFRFDTLPSNAYVHNVYHDLQATTSNHVYIPTNELIQASAWDTSLLADGEYTVMLFAGDTRGNVGEFYQDVIVSQRDIVAPPQPLLDRVITDGSGVRYDWTGGAAPDLNGFRIYALVEGGIWNLAIDEQSLGPATQSYTGSFSAGEATYYYVAAVDTVVPPNESFQTDVYGVAAGTKRVLILDGFDRTESSGSWNQPWHTFGFVHGRSLAPTGVGFSSTSNDAVVGQRVRLEDYDAVVWILGDESTNDETFSAAEQIMVAAYLEAGGNLFVSGSEIAWDLGNRGSSTDKAFLRDYLKVDYAGDDSGSLTARGTASGIFSGISSFSYGTSPYAEDWPDYFNATAGGVPALVYGNGLTAGVQYEGSFGTSSETGRMVLLGFPFETITARAVQDEIIRRTVGFFFPELVSVAVDPEEILELTAAFPSPFNEQTTFAFTLPRPGEARLAVFDILGREVAELMRGRLPQGQHQVTWTPGSAAAGAYIGRLYFGGAVRTTTVIRVR